MGLIRDFHSLQSDQLGRTTLHTVSQKKVVNTGAKRRRNMHTKLGKMSGMKPGKQAVIMNAYRATDIKELN